jgi:hypothetical protein
MLDAITVAQQLFDKQSGSADIDYVIAGETNLMGLAELAVSTS